MTRESDNNSSDVREFQRIVNSHDVSDDAGQVRQNGLLDSNHWFFVLSDELVERRKQFTQRTLEVLSTAVVVKAVKQISLPLSPSRVRYNDN